MYGGYGVGMGPMYGGGLSSVYGGGLSSMYGGGLSSMYGGGLSSMFGGGLSSMYGNGISSMYGGGITGSMAGGGGIGMSLAPGGTQNTNSLLSQYQLEQPRIDVSGGAKIDESRRERRARLRRERRQELEAIEKHRQQKRQLAIHSTIEIVGHVLQILIQVMRSGLELFGVAFGTYYSLKALKALVKSNAGLPSIVTAQQHAAASRANFTGRNIVSKISKWKICLLIVALFVAMETMYSMHKRLRNAFWPRAASRAERRVCLTDEDESLEESLLQSEEYSSDDSNSTLGCVDGVKRSLMGSNGERRSKKKYIFVAMYDYDSPNTEGFIGFRAGDRFIVEHYVENGWCEAILMDGAERPMVKGFVPGNFLRFLRSETKL